MRVLVLNGPNLNLLGTREPEVYGSDTLDDLEQKARGWGAAMGVEVDTYQSNHEGDLIDQLQRTDVDGIVFNPAAYTHTSRALYDTIVAVSTPVVEVHISNVKEREEWRQQSLVEPAAAFTIYGRGLAGYRDAIRHLANLTKADVAESAYGDDPSQVGDLRGNGAHMVVLVHGGFWRHEWKRDTIESLAIDLTSRGFATFNIEYRRIGAGGTWPNMGHDVAAAIDHAAGIGRSPEAISVVGHSAGAHLAMWAARHTDAEVQQHIALSPIVDLERHARSQTFGAAEAQLLLDQGVPDPMSPGDIPTFLVHGESDRHVPIGHSVDLAGKHGLEMLTTSEGHFELLDPERDGWQRVVEHLSG